MQDFRKEEAECITVSAATSRLIKSLTARMQFEAARMQKSDGRRPNVDQ